jgi:hypothetical protein
MSIVEKVPGMSDSDLTNLQKNAQRLSESGDPKQRAAAGELLPAIAAELAAREAAKPPAKTRAKAKRAVAAPNPAPVPAEAETV